MFGSESLSLNFDLLSIQNDGVIMECWVFLQVSLPAFAFFVTCFSPSFSAVFYFDADNNRCRTRTRVAIIFIN